MNGLVVLYYIVWYDLIWYYIIWGSLMGPFGKLTQHVSYRRAVGLLILWSRLGALRKKHCCARRLRTVPLILPRRQQPNCYLRPTVPHFWDLIFKEFMKSPESPVASFWTPRGPPGGAQGTPRRSPGDLTGQQNIKLTSNSQQTHSKLTANPHQTHSKLTSNTQRTKPIYKYFIGSGTPDSSPLATVC